MQMFCCKTSLVLVISQITLPPTVLRAAVECREYACRQFLCAVFAIHTFLLFTTRRSIDPISHIVGFNCFVMLESAKITMRYPNSLPMKTFSLLLFVITASSASLNPPNYLIVQPSVLNLTTGLTSPPEVPFDPRFSSGLAYTDHVALDQRSFLATATVTMAIIASMDFNGQVGNFRNPLIPNFPGVSIQFRVAPPAQQVETRIAVWSIFVAVTNMAITGRYQKIRLNIYWNRVRIATLRILPRESSQLSLEQRSDLLRNASDSLPYLQSNMSATWKNDYPVNANITNISSYSDLDFDCLYLDDAEELSIGQVLGAIMAGLRGVASVPKNDRMDGAFSTHTATFDTKVAFFGDESDPNHPTYQYKYVIETLHKMPSWLLSQGRLAEMTCAFGVGRHYGTALLEQLGRPD